MPSATSKQTESRHNEIENESYTDFEIFQP